MDGDNIFISNLSNGIDLYSLRTMQRLRHYESVVTVNVPFQVALARQALDRVVLGDASGILRVYDRETGEHVHSLEHQVKGRVQVVDVSLLRKICYTVLQRYLGWEYARGRVYCRCVIYSGSERSNSSLVFEGGLSGFSG